MSDDKKEESKSTAEDAVEEVKDEVTEAVEETVKATEEKAADKEAAPKEEEAKVEEKSDALKKAEAILGESSDDAKPEKSEKLKKAERILGERGGGGRGGRGRDDDDDDMFEKVVFINRCAKVVKGGRRFSFSALVVSGNREGSVGVGFGKAKEVAECIKKASESSRKDMMKVKITENTIPHTVIGRAGGGKVLLRPASPGTGLIAGGGVRAVVEAAGIKDILAKSMGSNNHCNVVKATINALEQLRTKEEVYALRGKQLADKKAL